MGCQTGKFQRSLDLMFLGFLFYLGGGGGYKKRGAIGQVESVGKLKQKTAVAVECSIVFLVSIVKSSIRVTLPKKIPCATSFLLSFHSVMYPGCENITPRNMEHIM
jgi:hypothetical protein